jgi:histidyl-tRNA synthetase
LRAYFGRHEAQLPDLEQRRLETNPLRLLDSKDPAMGALVAAAPRISDSLCDACAVHFAAVQAHLRAMGVPFRLEPTLVRGLDYYTRTAFEYYRHGAEGQQQALGGGGRYDGLVELLGGRATPGIGFALGLDRVLLALEGAEGSPGQAVPPLAVVVGADPGDTAARLRVASLLRAEGLWARAELAPRKLARQLEAASKEHAHFAVIIGDELAGGNVQLKDLEAGTQHLVPLADLAHELARAAKSHHHG